MKQLDANKLQEVQGGNQLVAGLLIAGAITFIIGVVDGYIRPLNCN